MKTATAFLCFMFLVGVNKSESVNVGPPSLSVSSDVRIVVRLNGKDVQGASVDFYQEEKVPGNPGAVNEVLRFSLLTNEFGLAAHNKLALGDYEVTATHDEDTSGPLLLHVVEDGGDSIAVIRLYSAQVPEIPADLPAGAQLRSLDGNVTDAMDAVIPAATIRVVKRARGYPTVLYVRADARGHFSGELQEGSYIAICSAEGFHAAIIPFVIKKQGSGNLRVQLQISDLPTT